MIKSDSCSIFSLIFEIYYWIWNMGSSRFSSTDLKLISSNWSFIGNVLVLIRGNSKWLVSSFSAQYDLSSIFILRHTISKYFPFIVYWFLHIDQVLEIYWLWLDLIGSDCSMIFWLSVTQLLFFVTIPPYFWPFLFITTYWSVIGNISALISSD